MTNLPIRTRIAATIGHLYPFLSGCGSVANSHWPVARLYADTRSSVGLSLGCPLLAEFDWPAVMNTSPTPIRCTDVSPTRAAPSKARSSSSYHPPGRVIVFENVPPVGAVSMGIQLVAVPG